MNSVLIPVEKVNFANHILVTSAQDILCIAKPLQRFGISHFAYQKLHEDGSVELLGTHPGFTERFIKDRLYENTFVGNVKNYVSCCALWRDLNCEELIELAKDGFNIGNGFVITKRSTNFCEFFYFASTPKNYQVNSFYINNMDFFERFIQNFKNRAFSILSKANMQRILYDSHEDKTLLTCNEWKKNIIHEEKSKKYGMNVTKREFDCAFYLKTGASAKEIAKILNISPRTVERHTDNIKEKFKCKTKNQLIALLQDFSFNR